MNKKKISLSLSNMNGEGNETKKEENDSKNTFIFKYSELEEKTTGLDTKDNILLKVKNYFEGKNPESDLSYEWLNKDKNINLICSCFEINKDSPDEILDKRDINCEFDLLNLLTGTNAHLHELIKLPKSFNKYNRYNDIIPYGYNALNYEEKSEITDENYVNASFIRGPLDEDNSFICTQGPLKATIENFWKMILRKKVMIMVMLCNLKEECDRRKCDKYWPDKNEPIKFNDLEVYYNYEENIQQDSIIKRGFILYDVKTGTKSEVIQLHVISWPDYQAPDEKFAEPMLKEITSYINKYYGQSPILVHCSAGIGRSGTLIAIYNIISCLQKLKEIKKEIYFANVFNIVRKLREQRIKMVTTVEQYKLIYEYIIKWINNSK